MTGHHRREWQLLPLDSIPGGNRDIDDVPASHHLAPELRGPWDSRVLPNPYTLGRRSFNSRLSIELISYTCVNLSTWAKIGLSFDCQGEGVIPESASFIVGQKRL
jgi:hypothetical protein